MLVSVVIPSFNAQAHIADTLRSVLDQQHDSFEVIVVDDGSSDDTVAQVRPFEARGVRLVQQANAGAAAARNHGLSLAKGRAILFLDADDLIGPGHLRALDDALAGSDTHVAFGQWDRFRIDPAEATFPARPGYRDADPVDWIVEDWRAGQPMTQCGTFLIPRGLLDAVGGWNERLSLIDDFEFFARLLCGSTGMRYAAQARVFYRSAQTNSLSGRKGERAARSALDSLMLGTAHLLARENSPRTRSAAANMLQGFDFAHFPAHSALRMRARARAAELGGATLPPDGPPGFQRLRRLIGWRAARRAQHLVERLRPGRAPSAGRH